ncbi:taste receptor type 2 member 40-like [Pleurodeles waltl]|uniref:taste receptor type 2 member 40-like n=1 Tax=Pleurodeles waltl TaxID=8319 RepID=UPI0037096084
MMLMGTTSNVFMAAVIAGQWTGSGHLPPPRNLLLLALGMINIPCQIFPAGQIFLCYLWGEVCNSVSVSITFYVLTPLLFISSFWFNTWLCLFYCIKIVNFSHPLFMRLKLGIDSFVSWSLLSSVLTALAISVPGIFYLEKSAPVNSTTTNVTVAEMVVNYRLWHALLMSIVGVLVPLVVIGISAVLILNSLYKHTRQMQRNHTGFTAGPSMDAHTRAAKTIFSLMVLYVLFDVALLFALTDDTGYAEISKFYVYVCGVTSYPFLNSVILINGNPKLKEVAMNFVCLHEA